LQFCPSGHYTVCRQRFADIAGRKVSVIYKWCPCQDEEEAFRQAFDQRIQQSSFYVECRGHRLHVLGELADEKIRSMKRIFHEVLKELCGKSDECFPDEVDVFINEKWRSTLGRAISDSQIKISTRVVSREDVFCWVLSHELRHIWQKHTGVRASEKDADMFGMKICNNLGIHSNLKNEHTR